MIEILLTIVALSILGYHAWYVYEKNKEVSKLVNALVAKTPEQFRDMTLADKVVPINPQIVQAPPDFVPESELTDEKFAEMIEREANGSV